MVQAKIVHNVSHLGTHYTLGGNAPSRYALNNGWIKEKTRQFLCAKESALSYVLRIPFTLSHSSQFDGVKLKTAV